MSNWRLQTFRLGLSRIKRRPVQTTINLLKKPHWYLQKSYGPFKLGQFEVDQLTFVQHLFPEVELVDLQNYFNEIDNLLANPEGLLFDFQPPEVGAPSFDEAAILYVAVRMLRPEKVIETGTGSGTSSSFILAGLSMNKRGLLYSIDLPRAVITKGGPSGEPGWLIPAKLRSRFRQILGKSEDRLPPLLKELGEIDMFFHDGEHEYHNQKFEYKVAREFLKPGGLLLSHDVDLAYVSLCRRLNITPVNFQRLGGILKLKEQK